MRGQNNSSAKSENTSASKHDISQYPIKPTDDIGKAESIIEIEDDSYIEIVERYSSWHEYKLKHPQRANAYIFTQIPYD